ncbi:MAG: ABC transporter ATP-binding protein [Anaerolineae bacterium]
MSELAQMMIVTEGLTKVYSDGTEVRALDGVDLSVERGEFVAVIGPSGSGKSTLLNLLGTLDMPTAGRVVVDGVDVSALQGDALADFRRAEIGFVFQLFNLVPILSALENVMLPLIPYRRQCKFDLEARARELLDGVGLAERAGHLPSQLSGGEQQRVAIARALVNEPEIVLVDEPTGNLDTRAGDQVMELLRRVCDEMGRTVVLVTHGPRVAAFADRVYFLKDGAIADQTRLGGERSLEAVWRRLGLG